MATLFTKIINQEIPSYKIAENDQFYAFLDIRPISPGHTLVIPKIETDHFYELPDSYLTQIMVFAKPIVHAIEESVQCLRVGSMIAGLEVPHAHLHLVPIQSMQTFTFAHAKLAEDDELQDLQKRIVNCLG
jgi:histidine triad (HIT) family protein